MKNLEKLKNLLIKKLKFDDVNIFVKDKEKYLGDYTGLVVKHLFEQDVVISIDSNQNYIISTIDYLSNSSRSLIVDIKSLHDLLILILQILKIKNIEIKSKKKTESEN